MGKKGGIFRYADGVDKLLMVFGTLGSIGDGLMTPLTMFVLSRVINEYGGATLSFSNEVVDKYGLRLLILAIGVGISAFMEGVCWTRTAERQASRMRIEYLKSVLRQEVAFFDSQANSSITFQVISTISSDAHLIQDTIAEKIPNCLAHLSSFIFCFPVAFVLSWRLALAALPCSIMFMIPGIGIGNVMKKLGGKIAGAYGVAGGIAEQAISSIRTVYSYVGENQTLKKFGIALEKCTELGIKQGFTKGLLIGSMGMIYAAWAFQAWVGSKLVTERGEKGGLVFISGICVILGGNGVPDISYYPDDIIDQKTKHPRNPQAPKSGRSSWKNSPAPRSGETNWHTPRSVTPSWQNSPAYPVTPIFSISIENSFQAHYDDFDDENISHRSSSLWRLLQMNAPEWKQAILGCIGAAGFGAIQPVHAYCLGTVISVYFQTDKSKILSDTRFYCYIFLSLAVLSFIANLLQHYNFAVMGERLSKRVRIQMLEKILTFEIGWFDKDDNTSAAICARLTTEASMRVKFLLKSLKG
ncbi:unnamed protein product [Malus baccata var. baccata]